MPWSCPLRRVHNTSDDIKGSELHAGNFLFRRIVNPPPYFDLFLSPPGVAPVENRSGQLRVNASAGLLPGEQKLGMCFSQEWVKYQETRCSTRQPRLLSPAAHTHTNWSDTYAQNVTPAQPVYLVPSSSGDAISYDRFKRDGFEGKGRVDLSRYSNKRRLQSIIATLVDCCRAHKIRLFWRAQAAWPFL